MNLDNLPHYVYRYYDATDRALYVGCTCDVARREKQHRNKAWFPNVVRREIEKFENKYAGRAAEEAWIQREQPIHNQQRKYEPYSGDQLWFEINMEIAKNPGESSEIMARYQPAINDRIRLSQAEVEAENKMWQRTQRRLRESRYRNARLKRAA